MTSCGSSSDDEGGANVNPLNPVEPVVPKNPLTPQQQKERMDVIAKEFMSMTPSSDFADIDALGEYVESTYANYNWDKVGNWAKNLYDISKQSLGTTTETETEKWYYYTYDYTYVYNNYKAILLASNFTGHFTAANGSWVLSSANDLQFIFTDSKGQECRLKLETSGNVKQVYVGNISDWTHGEYLGSFDTNNDGWTDYYKYKEYYDRDQIVIGVPQKMVLSLTQAGKDVVRAEFNFDLTVIDERFDLSQNNMLHSLKWVYDNSQIRIHNDVYYTQYKSNFSFSPDMRFRYFVWFFIFVTVITVAGCSIDEIEEQETDELVIEGWIEDDGFPVVIVTKEVKISDDYQKADVLIDNIVKWAKVSVVCDEDTIVLTGKIEKSYLPFYIYTTGHMRGESGKTYKLIVEYDNKYITATTVIPKRAHIDSVYCEPVSWCDSIYQVSIDFTDNPHEKNYYQILSKVGDSSRQYLVSQKGSIDDSDIKSGRNRYDVIRGRIGMGAHTVPIVVR